jgi:hypothetical protein
MDSASSGDIVVRRCEHENKTLGFIKGIFS